MTWVHEEEDERLPGACLECIAARTTFCTTPTPDAASPCGFRYPDDDGTACGTYGGPMHIYGHPHQPTRCLCGHPIRRAE